MGKRVLVCGAGSIGRRYSNNLLQLGAEVLVWRARRELLVEIARDFPVQACTNLNSCLAVIEAGVVATATDEHVAIDKAALKAGRVLIIKKPLSHDWVGIDNLSRRVKGKVIEVGFHVRAHPNLIALAARRKPLQ